MSFLRSRKPKLTRGQSLASYPVVNQLIKYEELENGELRVRIPRKKTGTARLIARTFKLPLYKDLVLDELGTFVVKLCDSEHTVKQIIDVFGKKYKLNPREAEVSMIEYLKMLTQRGIIGLAIPVEREKPGMDENTETNSADRKKKKNKWKERKKKRRRKR